MCSSPRLFSWAGSASGIAPSSRAAAPIRAAEMLALRGRMVDAIGRPVAGATFIGVYEERVLRRFTGAETTTDARGEFRGEFQLPPAS